MLTPPTPEPLRRVHASARPGPGQHMDEIRLIDSRVCDDAAEREWLLLTLLPPLPARSNCSPPLLLDFREEPRLESVSD